MTYISYTTFCIVIFTKLGCYHLYFENIEFIKPNIYIENDADVFSLGEGKNLTFTYNVTSYPAADIFWWRLKDHELITSCFSANNLCENHTGPEYITRSKFEVKSVTFPKYNRSYKINATNIKGYEMKTISIQVLG